MMNENEVKFNQEFDPYFKSGSPAKIQEGINIARSKGAFIFSPSPIPIGESPILMPTVSVVFLKDTEIYESQKNFRISYVGLARMAFAANFKWDINHTHRTDNGANLMYCSFQAVGGPMTSDGSIAFQEGHKDIDLEVEEMELEEKVSKNWDFVKDIKEDDRNFWKKKGYTNKADFVRGETRRELIPKRRNKLTFVESGAKARVIRPILGLQGNYKNSGQLLGMPFVFVQFKINHNREDVKQILLSNLPEAMSSVYGGKAVLPQHACQNTIDITPSQDQESPIVEDEQQGMDHQDNNDVPQDDGFDAQGTEDPALTDFENLDIEWQVKNLKEMCKKIGHDWDAYEKQAGEGGIAAVNQDWRNAFFIDIAAKIKQGGDNA